MTLSQGRLRRRLVAAGISLGLTALAVLAAMLVNHATYRLLGAEPLPMTRTATLVTAVVVALPIVALLVGGIFRSRGRERVLAAREALLGAAHAYARIGVWDYDPATGRFAMPEILHQSLGDPDMSLSLTAPLLLEMTHPEDREHIAAALSRMVEDGVPAQLEYRIRGLDGRENAFWVSGVPMRGEDGQSSRIFGLYMDITERKAIEAALRESEDHHRHMVELNPGIPWVADLSGGMMEVSGRWLALTGMSREETLGLGWMRALHPKDHGAAQAGWAGLMARGEPVDIEVRIRLADGGYRWFRSRAAPRRDAAGAILRWYGTLEDIHDRKLADLDLRASEAFASSILANTTDAIEVIGLDGRVQYINPPGRRLYEITGEEDMAGRDWAGSCPQDARDMAGQALERARAGLVTEFVGQCATRDGEPRWWDVSVSAIPGHDGRPARILAVSRDITAQRMVQERIEHLAHHDSLTGLMSRPRFREILEAEIAGASWMSRKALLFLDLDDFKSVNDTLGHPAGDEVLRAVGQRLRGNLRDADAIARLGGDEFAILLSDAGSATEVEALARRMIGCLGQPFPVEGQDVFVGASVGIAIADDPSDAADDLLRRADIALYRAKAAGRGAFRLSDPFMEREAEERHRLRHELHEAVRRDEFRLVFQPIVEFDTSRVTGFEALLRWDNPRRGPLDPGAFIALAEETGDIEAIGEWVLRQACASAAAWSDGLVVSVNLSARQFRDPAALLEAVAQALAGSSLPPGRLQLEITESLLLQDSVTVIDTLEELRERGVLIAIDDFGTGYSSLGYLQRFSVDSIKIDRRFVADVFENPRTVAILQALVALARNLGVPLTAEGIEDPEQRDRLRALGCAQGQGYLFARPMPPGEIEAFLRDRGQAPRGERRLRLVRD